MARARKKPGEFQLIARYFAPLAKSFPGADGLRSDNAFLAADARRDLVVKTDTVVAGVHFLADERPEFVAAKALRVCLSDLAAGGAAPYAYQLSIALPPDWSAGWIGRFARGLAADQRRYGVVLCGGDTVRTPGPLSITITAFGRVARGKGLRRSTAKAGDDLWVTGTVGDGALGLLVARGKLQGAALERRYRLPEPRTALGTRLVGIAHAAADVSDGLLADIGHIARASKLGFTLDRALVPLSPDARRAVGSDPKLWANILGGGDDYELVLAVPPRNRAKLEAAARRAGVAVTRIGRFTRARETPPLRGYTHF